MTTYDVQVVYSYMPKVNDKHVAFCGSITASTPKAAMRVAVARYGYAANITVSWHDEDHMWCQMMRYPTA